MEALLTRMSIRPNSLTVLSTTSLQKSEEIRCECERQTPTLLCLSSYKDNLIRLHKVLL